MRLSLPILAGFVLFSLGCRDKTPPLSSRSAPELKRFCGKDNTEACRLLCVKYRSLPGCTRARKLGDDLACKRRDTMEAALKPAAPDARVNTVGAPVAAWAPPKRADARVGEWHGRLYALCRQGHEIACETLGDYAPLPKAATAQAAPILAALKKGCEERKASYCNLLASFELDRAFPELEPADAYVHSARACTLSKGRFACARAGEMALAGVGRAPDVRTGIAHLRMGCDSQDHEACYALARHYAIDPKGGLRNHKVTGLLRRACHAGSDLACASLACRVSDKPARPIAPASPKEGKALYDLVNGLCKKGNTFACLQVARFEMRGVGTKKDVFAATTHATPLCEKGYAEACHMAVVASWFEKKGRPALTTLAPLAQKGCTLGHGRSCLVAGGLAQKMNAPDKAFTFFDRGCHLGDMSACAFAGEALVKGVLGEKNSAKAAKYLEYACTGGLIDACVIVTELYVREDLRDLEEKERGYDRLRPLCSLHARGMCGYLAHVLYRGWGVEADPKKAWDLARERCSAGSGAACWAAGRMALAKRTAKKILGKVRFTILGDRRQGISYFASGCKQGHAGACAEWATAVAPKVLKSRGKRRRNSKQLAKNVATAAYIGCSQDWPGACLVKNQLAAAGITHTPQK